MVREVEGTKCLSTSKQDSFIAENIENKGPVQEDSDSYDQNEEGQYRMYML